jgi:long-chain acyl-CoA synthetase
MDPTPYLTDAVPAPKALFDRLDARRDLVRFQVRGPDGAWTPVSWREYAAGIRALACWLADLGVGAGERACIFAPNRVAWMQAAMGIQSAGGALVPLYPSSTADQAGYVIAHSDARVLFVDTDSAVERVLLAWPACKDVERVVLLSDGVDPARIAARLRAAGHSAPSDSEIAARFVPWSRALADGAAVDARTPGAFEARLASLSLDQWSMMLYTSGTSGRPKGVPLTYRNVTANGQDWLTCLAPLVEEGDVDLLWLPMSHVFGFGEGCIGDSLGWTSWMCEPADVLGLLGEVRPTVLMSVPAYWEKLASQAAAGGSPEARADRLRALTGGRLRFCLSGGAGLKREVKDAFREAGLLLIEGYGLTECSPTLTMNRPEAYRFDSVGRPFPSVELRLAGDGEILARGPNVFGGYHKDPEATAEAFDPDGWFRTGDVGRFTEDGFLQIIDRKKDILVTAGGKNVPPANIEQAFQDDPFIEHLVVYGDGKRYLTAGVWPHWPAVEAELRARGGGRDGDAVHALLAERIEAGNSGLASFETIKRFRVMGDALTVDGGLLTATLKVKRKAVYARYEALFEELYA